MKPKTNDEIIRKLKTRGWKSAEEVDKFFLKVLEAKDRQHEADLREIAEIYIGMEGFDTRTACGAYQERIIKEIYDLTITKLNEAQNKR